MWTVCRTEILQQTCLPKFTSCTGALQCITEEVPSAFVVALPTEKRVGQDIHGQVNENLDMSKCQTADDVTQGSENQISKFTNICNIINIGDYLHVSICK